MCDSNVAKYYMAEYKSDVLSALVPVRQAGAVLPTLLAGLTLVQARLGRRPSSHN